MDCCLEAFTRDEDRHTVRGHDSKRQRASSTPQSVRDAVGTGDRLDGHTRVCLLYGSEPLEEFFRRWSATDESNLDGTMMIRQHGAESIREGSLPGLG